ncbi:MAG: ArsR family transcriptional regulator [Sphaerobacteraceae bacterium]|nr:MAG: ArsR family transcriptional regulator [Sphaerobacteraceae bacterium]
MVNDIDQTISALADPIRRQVVEHLRHGSHRASELADLVGVSRPGLSRHLRVLRRSGIVQVTISDADARERFYELRPERFLALQAWLDQVQAFWEDQLSSFQKHASETRTDKTP